MKKLILATVLAAFTLPATASTGCSVLKVYMTQEDGSPLEGTPDNSLVDMTCGLDKDALLAHHYALKAAVGAAYVRAIDPSDDVRNAVVNAVTD